jgi:ferredoxin
MIKTKAKDSYIAVLYIKACLGCGDCIEQCPTGEIPHNLVGFYSHLLNIDNSKCNGCGTCISNCIQNAIKLIKIN